MSQRNELLTKLLSNPKDLTWKELTTILSSFGYKELKKGKTGGARRKFCDEKNNVISLHKPHPGNIVKEYVIKQIITQLKEEGKIENE